MCIHFHLRAQSAHLVRVQQCLEKNTTKIKTNSCRAVHKPCGSSPAIRRGGLGKTSFAGTAQAPRSSPRCWVTPGAAGGLKGPASTPALLESASPGEAMPVSRTKEWGAIKSLCGDEWCVCAAGRFSRTSRHACLSAWLHSIFVHFLCHFIAAQLHIKSDLSALD